MQVNTVYTTLKYKKCFSSEQEHQALNKMKTEVRGDQKQQHNKACYFTKLNLSCKI